MAADFLRSGDTVEESIANAKLASAAPRLLRAVALLGADNGPLWDWCNQKNIGKEEWTRRRELADLVLEAVDLATK